MSDASFAKLDAQLVACATLGDEINVRRLLDQGAEPSLTVQRLVDGQAVKVPLGMFLVQSMFDPPSDNRDPSSYQAISQLLIDRTRLIQPSAFVLASVFEQKRGQGEPTQVVRYVDPATPEDTQEVIIRDKRVFEQLFRLVPRAYQEEVRAEQRVVEVKTEAPVIVDELAARRQRRRQP